MIDFYESCEQKTSIVTFEMTTSLHSALNHDIIERTSEE